MLNRFAGIGLVAMALLAWQPGARADSLHVVKSNPAAGAAVDATSNQYEVLFDGQVDPRNSRLTITRDGQVIETLHPSLDAGPGVLFARGPRLTTGDYKLHWLVKSLTGAEITEGDIPFSVKP
jgi:methionine-rich copper-binding protein CopC